MVTSLTWQQVLDEFQRIWGYPDFRPPQGEIVKSLLERRDALIVLPTGGGKSICFQLPALLQTGVTLVVSPLVALMENQVQELLQRRLPAAALHSQMPSYKRREVLRHLDLGRLRLLYLSPETLFSPPVWEKLLQPNLPINGLILDEAHCLVQWGDTFRPAYRRLGAVRPALMQGREASTKFPIAAFTATANPTTQRILRQVLRLETPMVVQLNPLRPNLHLSVQVAFTQRDRKQLLRRYLQRRRSTGLVYARTRKDCEGLATWLRQQGYQTAAYHGGMEGEDRRRIEADWLEDRLQFVVATNAFGTGVNKPDVRWVFHYQAPNHVIDYVQEVGRAGRDRNPATALTLVSEPTGWFDSCDRTRAKFFQTQAQILQQQAQAIAQQIPQQGDIREISQRFEGAAIALSWLHSTGQLEWLDPFHYQLIKGKSGSPPQSSVDEMHRYLHSRRCRWVQLLELFGFKQEAQQLNRCGHCYNCNR